MENTLAENIRFFRRERKMTQEQLAEALGLTVGTIYKWEKDLSTPDIGLIMDMAELFGTSTDVLLGYQWQTGNAGRALARIQTLTQEKRYAEAVAEAEKALRKYPNHFEIVYHSALAYLNLSSGFDLTSGITPEQKKAHDRGAALFEHACELLPQNTDERISEVSIRQNLAMLHETCQYIEQAIETLKQCNVCGINNGRIGMLYDNYIHDPAKAEPYLAKAFETLMNDMDAVFLGLADMFYRRGECDRAIDCLSLLRKVLRGTGQEAELTVFDRYDVWLLRTIAEMYCFKGEFAQAKRCAEEQGQATGKLKDLLAGLDVLRSFGREGRFLRDSKAASDGLEQPKYRLSSARAAVGGGIAVVSATCQLLVLLLVGALSIAGLIAQSAILGCGNLCSAIYNGLGRLGELHVGIRASKPYFEKITVHAGEPAVESGDDFLPVRHGIAVENLSFRYGEKPVLENASFRFDQGGKYALTGPSGCGKSTLLKLLLGWLPDYSGTIRFDGRDARDLTPEQLQRQMSYIEQDVFLFNTTIRENITLGDAFSEEALAQAVRDSALEGDLANMPQGLNTPVGEGGGNLSGGQKQRVAIARALLHRRSILLVDEGTSALDQKNADIVEQSLLENPDLTLILVSHHLSPARKAQFTKVYQLSPAELCTT